MDWLSGDHVMDPKDQRRMPRFKRRLNLRYSRDGKRFRSAFTSDAGPGGFYVVSKSTEDTGQRLEVEIDLPDVGRVKVLGEVRWLKSVPANLQAVQRGGFGVKVLHAPEEWFQFFAGLTSTE